MAQKSTIEVVDIIYRLLDASLVKSSITGAISKYQRPYQSEKVDVTIGAIGLGSEVISTGIFNVNIHAPNLKITTGGVLNQSQPDVSTLRTVTRKCIDALTDVWGSDYNLTVQQDTGTYVEDKSSYNNLRIEFNSLNY